ncbi:glycosyltransferase [Qipengyuania qiaonensis]|uniref:Glycosyltransferase n=1 Tax=Qipengyuania qiaonensis TaxID=2867240 RepID=A0ABS7J8K4_9SPHN|nr:glycosyltransferase [Qipengyuania qiaonensis]MBX7483650.1 glycosyltransferase [Qipengyuania qiaonensis]
MKILFVTGRAHFPQSVGGVQSSTDSSIRMLEGRGHSCAVACSLWGKGLFALRTRLKMKLSRRSYAKDEINGYSTYRAWNPVDHIVPIAREFGADVAVVQHQSTVPFVRALSNARIPVAVYLRNLEFSELEGDLRDLPRDVRYIANSRFTAGSYGKVFGIDATVLPPLVDAEKYRTDPTGKRVTMINPAREKGIDVFLTLAERCPDIPFTIVQGWGLPDDAAARIAAISRGADNVRLLPRTDDMRAVYAQARIVLAPSQWEEAWGRVASEAQVSGIPVIGSDRGGLPEAIGPGGLIVRHDAPAEEWEAALRSLWEDDGSWQRYSDAAKKHAARAEMAVSGHVDILHSVLEGALGAAGRR